MTSYVQLYFINPLTEVATACSPLLSDLQTKITQIASLLYSQRGQAIDYLDEHKYKILTGVSMSLTLFWIYLRCSADPKKPTAKRREQIPFTVFGS